MQERKIFKLTLLFAVAIFLMTAGFSCKMQSAAEKAAMQPVALSYWGVFNNTADFTELFADYKALHPNITINYSKFRPEEYNQKLLEAFAEDRGPDLFSIHNTWIGEYKNNLEPMPASVQIPFQEITGSIKKETITTIKTIPSISLMQLKNDFVEAVYDDCLRDGKIYCLPLNIDNLALYYNRDLLNANAIPFPPKTWAEFQEDVQKITKYDKDGYILQSAASLGTSANISRFSDILSLLMIQNGAVMSDGGKVVFNMPIGESKYVPAVRALQFYKAFSDSSKEVYTWNNEMPNSLDAFIQGRTAFFFGYSYHKPIIKASAPKLNFAISEVPQISEASLGSAGINVANYWVEVVPEKSKQKDIAWNFIQFAAADAKENGKYLARVKRPTALRVLVNSQLDDMDIATFAKQVLTSKSWYKGKNSGATEEIFSAMINFIGNSSDEKIYQQALNDAAKKVQQTY
ncbi:MAG: extracellular solute-binding protein [bacterium]